MQLSTLPPGLYLIINKISSKSCQKQVFDWKGNGNFIFFISQCNGLFGLIWSTHNYNVKIPFEAIWSTMALQLKLFTCACNILFVGNIRKLKLNKP